MEAIIKTVESIVVAWRDPKHALGPPLHNWKIKYFAQRRRGNDQLNPQATGKYCELSLLQVHAALGCYNLRQAEVDSEFEEDRIFSEKLESFGARAAKDWLFSRPIPANGLLKGAPSPLGSNISGSDIGTHYLHEAADDIETAAHFEIGVAHGNAAMTRHCQHQAQVDADLAARADSLEQARLAWPEKDKPLLR